MRGQRQHRTSLHAVSETVANIAGHSQTVDGLLQQLDQENKKLKADLAAAQRQLAALTGDSDAEPEDDSRAFGTHLRQAWAILRGK